MLERLRDLLPPGSTPAPAARVDRLYSLVAGGPGVTPGARRFNVLYVDETRLARSLDLAPVLSALASDLQLYVAEHARGRLFVHAGVVGWQGRAIVIPGRSMSGKTTLVRALVDAGATLYSDEYAVLDGRGRVHPYPQAPAGAAPAEEPLPIGLVVLTRYRPGGRWRPQRLSPGRAVIALLSHTVAARRHPAGALAVLGRAVAGAIAVSSVRGEAAEVAPAALAGAGTR